MRCDNINDNETSTANMFSSPSDTTTKTIQAKPSHKILPLAHSEVGFGYVKATSQHPGSP
jgi:hypothetical protein